MRVWVEYDAVETIEVRRGGYMEIDDDELANHHAYDLTSAVEDSLTAVGFDVENLSSEVTSDGPKYEDLNLVIRGER